MLDEFEEPEEEEPRPFTHEQARSESARQAFIDRWLASFAEREDILKLIAFDDDDPEIDEEGYPCTDVPKECVRFVLMLLYHGEMNLRPENRL